MLEDLGKEINTDRAVVPVPEEQSFNFIPQRDLKPEDWERMDKELENSQDILSFAHTLFSLIILNPNYQWKKTNIDWKKEIEEIDIQRFMDNSFMETVELAFCFKIIAQKDIFKKNYFVIQLKDKAEWLAKIGGEVWWDFVFLASRLKIFDQDPSKNPDISSEDWKKIWIKTKERLEEYRRKPWWEFVQFASCLKILDPKIDLRITDLEWKEIREELQDCKTSKLHNFANLAFSIAVLSAKDITFDDKGMHLVFEEKNKVAEDIPPVPRTFLNN